MNSPLMCVILAFVPAGVLSLFFEISQRIKDLRGSRVPVVSKLLRPPGESSRRKIQELDDKIGELLIWVIAFPATLLLGYLSSSGTGNGQVILWMLVLVLASVFLGFLIWKLLKLLHERDNWRLSFSGERAVGEQLNQLMADGCRVFHDFPLADNWNIDHIVVAPTGLFAVETRTKRKSVASDTQQAHEVIYDGHSLQFPLRKDTRDLQRASEQAARLQQFLNPHLNNFVSVQPILTLPGWYVISRALGEVIVVNPKMIDTAILSPSGTTLSSEAIKDISRLLDEKCRDVEF